MLDVNLAVTMLRQNHRMIDSNRNAGTRARVMISRLLNGTAGAFWLAAGLVLGLEAGLAPPACAQAPWPQDSSQAGSQDGSQDGSAAQPAEPGSAAETEVDMTGVDINNLDWSQLNIDASTLSSGIAAKSTARRAADGSEMTWSGKGKPNGASA